MKKKKQYFLPIIIWIGIAWDSPMNVVNVLFLRILYGVLHPTPAFVTLLETSVVYKNVSTSMTKQTTR